MNVLLIAPHPDDEVLGAGGTIARLVQEDNHVTVVIVTKGWKPLFPESQVEQVRGEARRAAQVLGVKVLEFMDLPVTKLSSIPRHEINGAFEKLMDKHEPELVFLPFYGDLQEDHRQVFEASMVALRPVKGRHRVKQIFCYETPSETHCSGRILSCCFVPQLWVDISAQLGTKLEAMKQYKSQLRDTPDARSLSGVEALAKFRGSVLALSAAECFMVVRQCWNI
jgi:LmbE family N-acetylglucosaminyl deacetylase